MPDGPPARGGGQHDPVVVDAFLKHSDDLLDAVETDSVWDAVLAAEPEPRPWLPDSRIDDSSDGDMRSRQFRSGAYGISEKWVRLRKS